jgi:hypothetical protein
MSYGSLILQLRRNLSPYNHCNLIARETFNSLTPAGRLGITDGGKAHLPNSRLRGFSEEPPERIHPIRRPLGDPPTTVKQPDSVISCATREAARDRQFSPWVQAEAGDDGGVILGHPLHQVPVLLRAHKIRGAPEQLAGSHLRSCPWRRGSWSGSGGRTSEVPLTAKRATPDAAAARMRAGATGATRGSWRWQCASKSRTAEAARAGAWAMTGGWMRWPVGGGGSEAVASVPRPVPPADSGSVGTHPSRPVLYWPSKMADALAQLTKFARAARFVWAFEAYPWPMRPLGQKVRD